jgi:hypothetical protein
VRATRPSLPCLPGPNGTRAQAAWQRRATHGASLDTRAAIASIRDAIARWRAQDHIVEAETPSTDTVAARAVPIGCLAIGVPHCRGGIAMHATSLHDRLHRWRDNVDYAMHPHLADADHPAPTRLADNPIRARLREVRFLPLAVPGMALVLACCAVLIGSLLRG